MTPLALILALALVRPAQVPSRLIRVAGGKHVD